MSAELHEGAVIALLEFLANEGYTSTDLLESGGDLFVELMISISNSRAVMAAAEAMIAKEMKE
jgi:hypothetical protein